MRVVCGLDVHKDSVFACILNENGAKFECKFGVLTPELEELHRLLLTILTLCFLIPNSRYKDIKPIQTILHTQY